MRASVGLIAALAVTTALVACVDHIVSGGAGGHAGGSGARGGSGGAVTSTGSTGSTTSTTSSGTGGQVGSSSGSGGAVVDAGTGGTGAGGSGTGAGGSGTGAGGSGTGGGTEGGAPVTCPAATSTCPAEAPYAGCPCVAGTGCGYFCPGEDTQYLVFATCEADGRWKVDTSCAPHPPCVCNPGEVCAGHSGSFGDLVYACVPDPCAPAPLSCTCGGKMLCGGWPNGCLVTGGDVWLCVSP